MQIEFTATDPTRDRQGCVVVGIQAPKELSAAAVRIDEASQGALTAALRSGDFKAEPGRTLLLRNLAGVAAERVLLVGCGPAAKLDAAAWRQTVTQLARVLKELGSTSAALYLPEVEVRERGLDWRVQQAVQIIGDGWYRFTGFKSDKEPAPKLKKICLPKAFLADPRVDCEGAARIGSALAQGMALARDLGNLPGNVCTPAYLASEARRLGRSAGLTVKVLGEAEMKRLGMGALLSVSKGSREEAKLITMQYKGGPSGAKPVVLVGKGITFDSGGISIKPAAAMDEMKYDMCGAASVFGTLLAAAQLKLPVNVTGVVPASENLPDGSASKPGDIVTTLSGKSVEILNTDAEGRLILCDALTYSARFKPDVVIDIATLTGACIVALGNHASGLMSNDDDLADALLSAGIRAHDRAWRLPLWPEYQEQIKSPFADMANVGGREAGTITAGCFLAKFTGAFRWAHLDIAGTAWVSGKEKSATGRPVPLLLQYLVDRAHAA
ncbi:MAG: leucyl aminopeptidase [Pseudomonadota bacterium]|nr:leucyl aminopeptidase [Pseudomonadota bacterium]